MKHWRGDSLVIYGALQLFPVTFQRYGLATELTNSVIYPNYLRFTD
jgi:hypothetical protein